MSTQNAAAKMARFGPLDRESFFDAQRRNRRATWRMSAFSILAAFAMGIPLSLALTPLIYGVILLGAEIYNLYSPLPAEFWRQAGELARLAGRVGDFVFNHKPIDPQSLVLGSIVVLLPGILLSLLLWAGIFILFRRGGVGGALLALSAREPNRSNLEELQLVDVIQEMAIAAGIPAPQLMLIDQGGANAAAIGTGISDARIVISRRLLEVLSREELEGVLAHLIASVGNGDLRIAFDVTSVFETYGLIVTLINSPFGPQARSTLWHIARLVFGRGTETRAREAETVAALLTKNVDLATDDIDNFFQAGSGKPTFFRKILTFAFFPILFTNLAIRLILWVCSMTMLEPAVALLWRTRQYLADACAVRLTRNPNCLASALQKLNDQNSSVPAVAWASHLFIVSPARTDRMHDNGSSRPELTQAMAAAWAKTNTEFDPSKTMTATELGTIKSEIMATRGAAFRGDAQAMSRLVAFGQAISAAHGDTFPIKFIDPADIEAARHGDPQAIARLRALSIKERAQFHDQSTSSEESSSLQESGSIPFHPPLKRRLKRLERMGAQVSVPEGEKGAWKVAAFLSVLFAPFALLLAGLFLLLIGVMVMASLVFLTLWLVAIHGVFSLLGHG
jgi:Zn-dependent protease with chaperone function